MKKVLLVAMADSIHTARWLDQFRGEPIEFVLFPSSPHRRVHPKIKEMLASDEGVNLRIDGLLRRFALPMWAIDRFVDNRLRGVLLRKLIRREKPDILHAMETQGGGYILRRALNSVESVPRTILTLWGSDLYWFRQFPRHRKKIEKTLQLIDDLAMECHRDIYIARELGFEGRVIPPFPVTGGYDDAAMYSSQNSEPPSKRTVILVKGHTRFVGKAEQGLYALKKIRRELKGFEIIVYSADTKARRLARRLRFMSGVTITCHKRGVFTHEEILDLLRRSRVFLGISLSDGISVSLQEALVTGAFPIQTNTSCADEWIIPGETGFLVSPYDTEAITHALLTALTDDTLVDSAAVKNRATANARLSSDNIRQVAKLFYAWPSEVQ